MTERDEVQDPETLPESHLRNRMPNTLCQLETQRLQKVRRLQRPEVQGCLLSCPASCSLPRTPPQARLTQTSRAWEVAPEPPHWPGPSFHQILDETAAGKAFGAGMSNNSLWS